MTLRDVNNVKVRVVLCVRGELVGVRVSMSCVVVIRLCGLVLSFVHLLVLLIVAHMCALVLVLWLWLNYLGRQLQRKLDGIRLLPRIVSIAMCLLVWASVIRRSPRLEVSIVVSRVPLWFVEAMTLLDSCLRSTTLVSLLLLNRAPCGVRPGYRFRRNVGTNISP